LRDALADATQADDPEGFPPHVSSGRSDPGAGAGESIELDDAPSDRQHEAKGEIRHSPMVRSLRGGDQHTQVRRRRDVDGLEADAPARDVLQRVSPLEHGARVPFGRRRDHRIVALDQLHHVLLEWASARPPMGPDAPTGATQGSEPRVVGAGHPWRGDEYLRHPCSIPA
jgi:hypothetical protein